MLRSRTILAALLFAAAPLNAQVVARVAAPALVPVVAGPAAVFAAPLFAAPSLSVPALAAFPAAAPALAAAPELLPASVPLGAASDGPRRIELPGVRAAANPTGITDGGRLFDGSSDLVTRSGSVFAPSRTAQPAFRGGVAFFRIQAAPVAPVKPVPDTQGLKGAALLDRVSRIAATGQTKREYHEASKYLFGTADNHTLNGTPGVADAYSGVFIPGTSPDGHDYSETGDPKHDGWSRAQSMNVEHVFPQSLFGKDLPMRSDLHHLMATFEHPNGMRGNLPFGAAKAPFDYKNDAGAKRDGRVFEPPDFTKGRVARAMLYFYARYKDQGFFNTHVAAFWNPQIATLLDWNRRFPPTVEEQRRNDQVQAFQGNRNPFVDDPGLADRIGAEALRSRPSAPARIRTVVAPQEIVRRSDKPRKGKKRSAYNRPHPSRRGFRR